MTDHNNQSKKLTLFNTATIAFVLALHGVIISALANIQSPQLRMPKQEQTPPIEIEFIQLIEEPPPNTVEPDPIPQPEPEPKRIPQPEPEPEPEPKPILESKFVQQPPPVIATDAQTEQHHQWEVEQQRLQEQASQERAAQERAAQERAAQERAAQERAAQERAAQERSAQEQAAQERAAQERAAANNAPQAMSINQASWQIEPHFVFPEQVKRKGRSGDVFSGTLTVIVDKQGNVTSVSITHSSANQTIDRAALKAMTQAKFNPFTKNGVPVVGRVVLPFNYRIP